MTSSIDRQTHTVFPEGDLTENDRSHNNMETDVFSDSSSDPQEANEDNSAEEEHSLIEKERKAQRLSRNKKIVILLLLVGFIIFIAVDSATNGYVRDGIQTFLKWIEDHPAAGVFAFVGVYFLATILFVPGSILTLGSGFVFANAFGLGFGVLLGTTAVFTGASAGAVVAFILGRYILRDWVKALTRRYAIFEAIDRALEEKGFRIMALLRLSPIIPFNALNYMAGITAVSFRAYCWSLIAILPGTTLYVFLGATAGSLTDSANRGENNAVTIVVIVVGIVFGVLGIVATSYYAKKELNKVIARREEEAESVSTIEASDYGSHNV